jgi:Peptidase propeptide and YPEB domain
MKKRNLIISVMLSTMIAISSIAGATAANNSPPLSETLKILQEKGYKNIYKIEVDDDAYEVDAVSLLGIEKDLRVNPYNGEILESHTGITHKWTKVHFFGVTALEVAQKVEAAGYHSITKIEAKDEKYKVKALNADNHSVILEVNTKNGEVKRDWFW